MRCTFHNVESNAIVFIQIYYQEIPSSTHLKNDDLKSKKKTETNANHDVLAK